MSRITVTRRENVERFTEDDIDLMNDEDVGTLVRTHALTVNQFNQETQQIQTGVIMRAEVYWDLKRIPAFTLEDPDDLVWLNFKEDVEADEPEQSESL